MTKSRNYGLDVARVVAIIGVIIMHVVGAGGGIELFSIRIN